MSNDVRFMKFRKLFIYKALPIKVEESPVAPQWGSINRDLIGGTSCIRGYEAFKSEYVALTELTTWSFLFFDYSINAYMSAAVCLVTISN